MCLGEAPFDVCVQNELNIPVARTLLTMGFKTGRQALMTPSRASRHVRRAIFIYRCRVFCALMLVVALMRTIVMAQILYVM